MRLARPLLALSLLALAASPAWAQGQARPDPIAKLEAARAQNPGNVAALRSLGVAYYKARRFADARIALDQARRLDPKDGISALYAGLSAEALGDPTAARAAYNGYLEHGKSRRAKQQVSARLVALSRQESLASAKAAVAAEATLSATPGPITTIAVPPFRYAGPDPSLQPLERGLAELVITDLARSSLLTVVERDRMQAISDEVALSRSDRVDAATAVRAGKLMQAGRLINGTMTQTGGQLALGASVVTVSTSEVGQPTMVTNTIAQLFAMEKQLVLGIFQSLGIELTPAERQLVDRRPTESMQAFLAYSRGLQAQDDGRFEDALRFFQAARTLDPNFTMASAKIAAAQEAAAGANVSAETIEPVLTGSEERTVDVAGTGDLDAPTRPADRIATITRTVTALNPITLAPLTFTTNPPAPTPDFDRTSSTTNTDQIGAVRGQVVIVVRRP